MNPGSSIPLISVILATYNREAYLMEAIQSVLDQTFNNWELIVINDQSTDRTGELVKAIGDTRIRHHATTQRLGITESRNEGLRLAQGEFIAFIDSDDLWAVDKLEKQWIAFCQYPAAAYCFTGGYNFREPGKPLNFYYDKKEGLLYGDLFIPFFKSEIAATTPSFMFRKKHLDTFGWFNGDKLFADIDFMLRFVKNTPGVIVYAPLIYRRLHDSNISNSGWEKGSEEGVDLIRSYRDLLPPSIVKEAFFRMYISFGEKYLKYKKPLKAIHKFFSAWKQKPFSIIPGKKIAKAILQVFTK